jgi:hypothetical protein
VTVCVAAICGNGSLLVGAADRMLTAGDVQFEPQQSKLMPVTSSIVAMIAGDAAMQIEILMDVRHDVQRRVEAEPQNWWTVRDVADLYAGYYSQARLRRAEASLLAPLGLDRTTFIQRQRELAPELARQIATELINFEPPRVSVIFAGIDPTGAHLYVAGNSGVTCQDGVAFASIGAGYWHADSQFMFAGHTRQRGLPETLLLTYSAKKRAEVAPGVGEGTDMFLLGEQLGSYTAIGPHVLDKLDEIYRANLKRVDVSTRRAEKEAIRYVEEITRPATPTEQTATDDSRGLDTAQAPADRPDNEPTA